MSCVEVNSQPDRDRQPHQQLHPQPDLRMSPSRARGRSAGFAGNLDGEASASCSVSPCPVHPGVLRACAAPGAMNELGDRPLLMFPTLVASSRSGCATIGLHPRHHPLNNQWLD